MFLPATSRASDFGLHPACLRTVHQLVQQSLPRPKPLMLLLGCRSSRDESSWRNSSFEEFLREFFLALHQSLHLTPWQHACRTGTVIASRSSPSAAWLPKARGASPARITPIFGWNSDHANQNSGSMMSCFKCVPFSRPATRSP